MFQAYNLVPMLTAKENIILPLMLVAIQETRRGSTRSSRPSASRTASSTGRASRRAAQQQRVAVARAMAAKPDIIFADEPTGNLDSRTGAEILDFLRRAVREYGQTIVMVTDDPNAASYADRVIFLGDGRIVDEMAEPTAESVIDR